MKKSLLIGMICEFVLAACALAILIVAAIFGAAGLAICAGLVFALLVYAGVGFIVENKSPGNRYFGWSIWFWNVFCVKWIYGSLRKIKKDKAMPAVTLGAICLSVALLLSVINIFTAPEIEKNRKEKELKALQEVLPEGTTFESITVTEEYPDVITGAYKSDAGFIFKAEVKGYQPGLIIMVGIDKDGKVAGVKHTASAETFGVEGELNEAYTKRQDSSDSLEMILSASASKGAPMTARAYYTAVEAALKAFAIVNDVKTPDQIINEGGNAALGTSGKKFVKWFATEVLDGVTATYVPEDNEGYVFLIGEVFVGVNNAGEVVTDGVSEEITATALAAYTKLAGSTLTEVSGEFTGVDSIHKTDSGNYVIVATAKGYKNGLSVKVAISNDGKILATEVVSHSETDSIGGAVLEDPSFNDSFVGTDHDGIFDVDSVSGATMTSSGYKAALEYAFNAFEALTQEGENE